MRVNSVMQKIPYFVENGSMAPKFVKEACRLSVHLDAVIKYISEIYMFSPLKYQVSHSFNTFFLNYFTSITITARTNCEQFGEISAKHNTYKLGCSLQGKHTIKCP